MSVRTRQLQLHTATVRRLLLGSVLLLGAVASWKAHAQAQPADSAAVQSVPPSAAETHRGGRRVALSSGQVQQAFRAMDKNGDSRLSREETAQFPRIERHFDRMDTDHDGSVSPAEFEAAIQQAS